MKKIKFLALALASALTFGFVGCDNDDDIEYTGTVLKNGDVITLSTKDDQASYELRFTFSINDGNLVVVGLNDTARVTGFQDFNYCPTVVKVVDLGKVSGLNKIDEYPADADFEGTSVPAVEKHGYVIKAIGDGKLDNYENPNLHDPLPQYARIWLEEDNGEGFNLRYEFPWTVPTE